MLVGIAELELLFGQFKVQIQHIVGSGDAVGYLHGQGWTCPRWNRQTKQESLPLVTKKLSHSARGVGNNDASRMVWFAVSDIHHAYTVGHTVMRLGCFCEVATYQVDIVLATPSTSFTS